MKNIKQFLKEFILITLSILIAFWIEDYREQKNDDRATRELLLNIKQDILANAEILTEYGSMQEKEIIPWMNAILEDLNNDCVIDSMYALMQLQNFTPILNLQSEGYENLKNSGLLSNIKDDTLLRAFKPLPIETRYLEDNLKRRALLESKIIEISYPATYSSLKKEWIMKQTNFPLSVKDCQQLNLLLSDWINMEQEFSYLIKYNANGIKTWLPRLDQEIANK